MHQKDFYNSTISKSMDSYYGHAPYNISRAAGSYLYDDRANKYLDIGMALGSVTLGYAYSEVDEHVVDAIRKGVNYSRPSCLEELLSKRLDAYFPYPSLAQFAKSSSMIQSCIPRVCRALTQKELIGFPINGAYLGNVDWYIGKTNKPKGVLRSTIDSSVNFEGGNIESLEKLFSSYADRLACIIMEPYRANIFSSEFYKTLRKLCTDNHVYLIFDETISGFRFNFPLAQKKVNCWADFTIIGKGLANGYALSAVITPYSLMEEILERPQHHDLYGFSSTHAGETIGLSAAYKTLEIYNREAVCEKINTLGSILLKKMRSSINRSGLESIITIEGQPSYFYLRTSSPNNDYAIRNHIYSTFFKQHILYRGTTALSLSHTYSEIELVAEIFDTAINTIKI